MSYIIYQTEGVILGKKDFGEADTALVIFTEQFGKIRAVAKGVRQLKSKLRYNLDLLSFSRFALISSELSGWRSWKIIDAEEIAGNRGIVSDYLKLALFARITGLFNRMIQGEEKNVFLWEEIKNVFDFLNKKNLTKEELKDFEVSTLLNILDNLGYLDKGRIFSNSTNRLLAVSAINKAIKESML